MRPAPRPTRRGTVLPIIAVCLVAIFSFVALAIDLGMLAVARTQAQNAADAAALIACRTLDNKQPDNAAYDNNRPAALAAGVSAVQGSPYMAGTFASAPTPTVRAGTYDYDPNKQTFVVNYPSSPPAGRSWTAVEVTLAVDQPTYFARLWGVTSMPSGARAVAVYRPRDVAFVLDMTGSMAFASTFNNSGTHLNADPLAPAFGHYVSVRNSIVATANETNGSGEAISRNNFTMTTPGGPPVVRDFYFSPANAADPTQETTLPADRSQLRPAFHAWSPSETPGDPTSYISQTYSFAGYNAFCPRDAGSMTGPTPAPDTFGTMTDGGGIAYVGDRWRRADGSVNKTDTTWATASAKTKAAGTAVELLGYALSGSNVCRTGTTSAIAPDTQFRDPVWEAVGYDLDVAKYRSDRGGGDPLVPRSQGGAYTPPLLPPADAFKGYSMGPGYWGKTFFIWPPDPRAPVGNPGDANYQPGDWRRRYFDPIASASAVKSGGTTTVNYTIGTFDPQADNNPYNGSGAGAFDSINEVLLNRGSGAMTLQPATSSQSVSTTNGGSTTNTVQTVSNYQIDYVQVLKWLKSGPQVLPPNLRAGRVLYYSSIPDDVDTNSGTIQTKLDKRFWKEYIDYVLGYRYTASTALAGVADSWAAAPQAYSTADLPPWAGPTGNWPSRRPYMRYTDSPRRPRMHFWFGPLSMMDFIANVGGNWNAGTLHEAQCWQLKAGMNSVLDDIRNNHPNDAVGMAMFAYTSSNGGAYKTIRVPMGQDFTGLKNALFFPSSLLPKINAGDATAEVRPYDSNFTSVPIDEIPNANGNTDPNTGLMLAFNLLSPSNQLPASVYGSVRGRRGASKVVIFETDGVPNAYSNGTFNALGYNSYYSTPTNGGSPGNGQEPSMSTALAVVRQIVKPMATSGSGGDSGLSLSNAPARVYPIAFGDLFDPAAAPNATFRPTAQQFLASVGAAGGTLPAGSTSLPAGQVITGSYQNRIDTLKTCLERIFQSGVSVTLVE